MNENCSFGLLALALCANALIASSASAQTLAWVPENGSTPAYTVWLQEGRPLRTLAGIWMAHEQRYWQWRKDRTTVLLDSCEAVWEEETDGINKSVVERAWLESPDGRRLAVYSPERVGSGQGVSEHEVSVQPVASLGPLLFFTARTHTFACGAHGDTTAAAFVFDLRSGRSTRVESRPLPLSFLAQVENLREPDDDPIPTVDASYPVLSADGEVRTRLLVAFGTNFASSGSDWSSYTRTVAAYGALSRSSAWRRLVPRSAVAMAYRVTQGRAAGVSVLESGLPPAWMISDFQTTPPPFTVSRRRGYRRGR